MPWADTVLREEREQIEADERVEVLKRRVEAVRSAKKTVGVTAAGGAAGEAAPVTGLFSLRKARNAKKAKA